MHSVTLNPPTVDLIAGGPSVTQVATISGVPADVPPTVDTTQLAVTVGNTVVNVSTTVGVAAIDNPSPVVSTSDGVNYTVLADTPVQDAVDPTVWTVNITYKA